MKTYTQITHGESLAKREFNLFCQFLLLERITLFDVAQFMQISIPHLFYISVWKRASSMSVKI